MDGPEHWASSSLLDRILRWYLDKIEKDPGRDTPLQEIKEPFRMKELESLVAMRTEEFGTAVLSLLEQLRAERFFREKQGQDLATSVASRIEMEKEGEKLKRKLKRAENRSLKYTRRLELSNARAQELEETIKKIGVNLQESKTNTQVFEMELTGLRKTAADLRVQLEEKIREINRMKDVNTNQYLRITKLETNLSETMSKVGAGETAMREVANLKNLLSHRIELNRELETQLSKQNEKMSGLESQVAALLLRVEAGEQKNRGLAEENVRLKESLSNMTGFQDAGQFVELKSKQAHISELETAVRTSKQREENERQKKDTLLKELEQVNDARKQKEAECGSLTLVLAEKDKQISQLVKQEQKQASLVLRLEEEKRYLTEEMTRKVETKLAQLTEVEKEGAQQLQAKISEIGDLEKKHSDLQLLISKTVKERDALDQQCKDLREALSKQLLKEGVLLKEVDRLEAANKALALERHAMAEDLKTKDKKLFEGKDQIDLLQGKANELQVVLKAKNHLETIAKDLQEALQTQKRAFENQQNEMKRLLATNTNLETRYKISASELLSKDMKLEELNSQISKLKDAFELLKSKAATEIDSKNKEMNELKACLIETRNMNKKQSSTLGTLEREKSQLLDQCTQLRLALEKERSARDDQAKDPVLTRKLAAKEQKLLEVSTQFSQLDAKYQNLEANHFQVVRQLETKSKEMAELHSQLEIVSLSPRENADLERKCEELRELLEHERISRESQANEIDTLNNTNSNLQSKCQELSVEVGTKDLRVDELVAQIVELKEQAAAMEVMKRNVVTLLRFASGGKMQDLLQGAEEKGDLISDAEELKQARMLLTQFSSASLRASVDKSPKLSSAERLSSPKLSAERLSSPEPLELASDDTKTRDVDALSISSGEDDAAQRVFELESWAEALEEDNRSMELALISLETDMIELESHRNLLEDVIHRALNQLNKKPGEKIVEVVETPSERTPDTPQLMDTTIRFVPIESPKVDSTKMISLTINKWLGDATYR